MSKKALVIVESPAKAKTIQGFLGSNYTVRSSFGHIRDLPKSGLSIDKENGFAPTYKVSDDKKKTITELKKLVKETDEVYLASDEDREGEAIAWHLCEALKLDATKTKRIVFHEITKTAINSAIDNPRTIDIDLVNAQQARRVLDRLVGYELSPVLWKKVRPGLSAGRVQSVAVRLITEREREIGKFEAESTYKVTAVFNVDGEELHAELSKRFDSTEESRAFLDDCVKAIYNIVSIETKPGFRKPGAPFTTSTLQQEAARRLGYPVRTTMQIAQRLYENGHITYMRTDSTYLSGLAIGAAKDYIYKEFGANYHELKQFKTKSAGAQEAHEAIRPTNFNRATAGDDNAQQKLYNLIWQRALASQMSPAKLDKTEITINISTREEQLKAVGEMVTFDGFLRVMGKTKDDTILPSVSKGQELQYATISATETFSRPPARYGEASLVRTLEEMGIGRPSTYAPTISTIQDRGYIEKRDLDGKPRNINELILDKGKIEQKVTEVITGADRGKLMPTHLAEMVTDFLVKYFEPIVDYKFTANAEAEFDEIAEGKKQWNTMIADFYNNRFVPLVNASESVTRAETSQGRELGKDPKTGKSIIARFGRYGAMLQMGEAGADAGEDAEKPTFAPMPKDTTLDSVTLEQALEMFKLPRLVGTTKEGEEIKANIGRFGPYIVVGKTFVSLKEHDPSTITETEAREVIENKAQADAEKNIKEFPGGIKVLKGLYGPYITDGKKNAKIPKDQDPTTLTNDECIKLLAEAPAKGKGRRWGGKKSAPAAKTKRTVKAKRHPKK